MLYKLRYWLSAEFLSWGVHIIPDEEAKEILSRNVMTGVNEMLEEIG